MAFPVVKTHHVCEEPVLQGGLPVNCQCRRVISHLPLFSAPRQKAEASPTAPLPPWMSCSLLPSRWVRTTLASTSSDTHSCWSAFSYPFKARSGSGPFAKSRPHHTDDWPNCFERPRKVQDWHMGEYWVQQLSTSCHCFVFFYSRKRHQNHPNLR